MPLQDASWICITSGSSCYIMLHLSISFGFVCDFGSFFQFTFLIRIRIPHRIDSNSDSWSIASIEIHRHDDRTISIHCSYWQEHHVVLIVSIAAQSTAIPRCLLRWPLLFFDTCQLKSKHCVNGLFDQHHPPAALTCSIHWKSKRSICLRCKRHYCGLDASKRILRQDNQSVGVLARCALVDSTTAVTSSFHLLTQNNSINHPNHSINYRPTNHLQDFPTAMQPWPRTATRSVCYPHAIARNHPVEWCRRRHDALMGIAFESLVDRRSARMRNRWVRDRILRLRPSSFDSHSKTPFLEMARHPNAIHCSISAPQTSSVEWLLLRFLARASLDAVSCYWISIHEISISLQLAISL